MAEKGIAIRLSLKDYDLVEKQLQSLGERGQAALERIKKASEEHKEGGLAIIDKAVEHVHEKLSEMGSEAGAVGETLMRLGAGGLVAAAGVAATVEVLGEARQAAALYQLAYVQVDAVLRATGATSGQTSKQLAAFAEEMERSTMATEEGVLKAASVLAMFQNVSGDSFKQAIRLSNDLAALRDKDIQSAVYDIGLALERLSQGSVEGLVKKFGMIPPATWDAIKALYETGGGAAAASRFLDELQTKIGGTSERLRGDTFIGAVKGAKDAWEELLKAIGKDLLPTTLINVGTGILREVKDQVDAMRTWIKGPEPGGEDRVRWAEDRATRARAAAAAARADLDRLGPGDTGLGMEALRGDLALAEQNARETALKADRDLDDARRAMRDQNKRELDATLAAQRKEAESNAAWINATREKYVELSLRMETDRAVKIRDIEKRLAEDVKNLEGRRGQVGVEGKDVDAALAVRRHLADLERQQVLANKTDAERNAEADAKVLADLTRKGELVESGARAQFVAAQADRLSADANAALRHEVERLAGAYWDAEQAQKAYAKADEDLMAARRRHDDDLSRDVGKLRQYFQPKRDTRFEQAQGTILEGYQAGLISEEERADYLRRAREEFTKEGRDYKLITHDVGAALGNASNAFLTDIRQSKSVMEAMRKTTAGLLDDIAKALWRRSVADPLASWITGSIFGVGAGEGGGGGDLDTSGFNLTGALHSARGNLFDAGHAVPFARGDVFDRTTYFPLAGGRAGMLGEAGPEGILPLSRRPDGKLGVLATGSGAPIHFAPVINVTAPPGPGGGGAGAANAQQWGAVIAQQINAAFREFVADQSRTGGVLNPLR